MPIKLYIDYGSQPSHTVLSFCYTLDLSPEITTLSILSAEHHNPPFPQINPARRQPALTDTDTNLHIFESASILRYLVNKFLTPNNPYYPRDCPQKQLIVETSLDDYYTKIRTMAMAGYSRYIAQMFGAKKYYNVAKS
jgi:glutathione S-transferase